MLRDIQAFHKWVEETKPSRAKWSRVRTWIAEIGDTSWKAPSVQWPDASQPPVYEVRYAWLQDVDVRIWYFHQYDNDDVDLIIVL